MRVDAIATLTPITPAIIAECVKAGARRINSLESASDTLDDCGDTLAATDTQGDKRGVEVAPFKLIECCPQQHRSCGTQRVAKCDGSTIHVHRRMVQLQLAHDLQGVWQQRPR